VGGSVAGEPQPGIRPLVWFFALTFISAFAIIKAWCCCWSLSFASDATVDPS
jgi:hypothetical protein